MKVFVLGLDGATFDVLTPMVEAGWMPNLQQALRDGTSGLLRSTVPPLSAQAWTTFQTGVNPGKHGVFDFNRNDRTRYENHPVNSSHVRVPRIWDILSEHGRSCGIVNVLFTYPPYPIKGFLVSGKDTPGEDKVYTHPSLLKQEILEFEPRFRTEMFRDFATSRDFLATVPERLVLQERVNRLLLDRHPVDFSATIFAVPDLIHHLFWKDMDPSHPLHDRHAAVARKPLLEKCFWTMDEFIGDRRRRLGPDDILMVLSDHGGGPLHRTVQINRWLRKQGLLALRGMKVSAGGLRPALRQLAKTVYARLPPAVRGGIRSRIGTWSRSRSLARRNDAIDWSLTKAYAGTIGEHGVHCNLRGREGQGIVERGREYEEVRDTIIAGLTTLRDPKNGELVIDGAYRREELYSGPALEDAPDIILDFGTRPYEPGDAPLGEDIVEDLRKDALTGMHRPYGILAAVGRNVRRGVRIEGARMLDVAPTILHAMGETVPGWMDGRVIEELFEDSFRRDHPVRRDDRTRAGDVGSQEVRLSEEEEADIQKRLQDLGYM